jgi:GSH-dependent disulfide-bond oxidoreductase
VLGGARGNMIELFYWTTPNGHKVAIFLEETGLPYRMRPVNISRGEQFAPEFLAISPNNKIPALIDHAPADGGEPLALFESGAILLYLAEKTGQLLPRSLRGRTRVIQWLMWQAGGFGPMLGQNHHFSSYAPEKIPYAISRYVKETRRLYTVLDRQLEGQECIAGDFSIADIATYPWVVPHRRQQLQLEEFPNVSRWFESLRQRPSIERAYAVAAAVNTVPTVTPESHRYLFGQDGSESQIEGESCPLT